MRKVASAKFSKLLEWIAMRYEADCWLAACAMAAGSSYEEAEEYFGPGAEYSDNTLFKSDDPEKRLVSNAIRLVAQLEFFVSHGCYPLFIPVVDPVLKAKRRYLLSSKSLSHDPQRQWMSHPIVLDRPLGERRLA